MAPGFAGQRKVGPHALNLPRFEMRDWLEITGRMPWGYEQAHTTSALRYARWILATGQQCGLSLANAPCFETWVFPHIPKTAGTAFVEALGRSSAVANVIVESFEEQGAESRRRVFQNAARTRIVFLSGHIHLKHWGDIIRWRGTEKILSIIRDPAEIQISNVNFILGRIANTLDGDESTISSLDALVDKWRRAFGSGAFHDPVRGELDSVAAWLAMVDAPFSPTAEWAHRLISSAAYDAIYREVILAYLGCGDEEVSETMEFLGRLAPTIVPIEYIGEFAKQTFGVTVPAGVNARKMSVLHKDDVDPAVMLRLVDKDRELFGRLMDFAWRPL